MNAELVTVTITCPTTWWERCDWIEKNCKNPQDTTSWAAWQIGQDDIRFIVSKRDAIMYYLHWG